MVSSSEEVILVDESDLPLGTLEKMEAHRRGLLHRAFSVFIFNKRGEMLLHQRALDKYHSAGLWTNACCSHPRPGEDIYEAAMRRLQEEMGFTTELEKIFTFTYRSEFGNGLIEHEFDHVFVGTHDEPFHPNEEEVKEHAFYSLSTIREELASHPDKYTYWFRLAFPLVEQWLLTKA